MGFLSRTKDKEKEEDAIEPAPCPHMSLLQR